MLFCPLFRSHFGQHFGGLKWDRSKYAKIVEGREKCAESFGELEKMGFQSCHICAAVKDND